MEDKNLANGRGIPIGLGMALAQNVDAMNYFSHLSNAQQQNIIDHTHQIRSKNEMQEFVSHISESDSFR
jgi:uncharacterized protein YdeI (YjbR/CyaY-like superfamily)